MPLGANRFKLLFLFLQAIAYFISVPTMVKKSPLVLIVTENEIQWIIFPFVRSSDKAPIVNAVEFEAQNLWLEDGVHINNKALLLCMIMSSPNFYIQPVEIEEGIRKIDLRDTIIGETPEVAEMIKELVYLRKELNYLRQERRQNSDDEKRFRVNEVQTK